LEKICCGIQTGGQAEVHANGQVKT